jgi:hypothetical protein
VVCAGADELSIRTMAPSIASIRCSMFSSM